MNPRTPEVTEPMLHWLLGIALGLILGYVWGQHDANSDHEARLRDVNTSLATSAKRIEAALGHGKMRNE